MISKSQNQSQRQTASSCSHPQLVLMQLPGSLSLSDFQKAGNCRFLASTAPSSSLMSSQSCCLVVESQGATFDLVKVETSNALVLIPPSACSTVTTEEPLLKRPKMDDDNNDDDKNHNRATELTSVHCRLLQAGGSGASFLELRPKSLSLKSLRSLLLPHLFDPYLQNDNDTTTSMTAWQGRTVDSLAHELLISQDQIYQGLERVHALALTPNGNTDHCVSYGLLSEEALQEGQCALLSTLAECRDFEHYATAEIPYESLIQESKKRMNETYPYVDQVLRHCVETTLLLTNEATNIDSALMKRPKKGNYVRLDIKKVSERLIDQTRLCWLRAPRQYVISTKKSLFSPSSLSGCHVRCQTTFSQTKGTMGGRSAINALAK